MGLSLYHRLPALGNISSRYFIMGKYWKEEEVRTQMLKERGLLEAYEAEQYWVT